MYYCSGDCQEGNWAHHKHFCGKAFGRFHESAVAAAMERVGRANPLTIYGNGKLLRSGAGGAGGAGGGGGGGGKKKKKKKGKKKR